MPEFILDYGSPEATYIYHALDKFTQGYIEAMFFTDTGYAENEGLEHACFAELAPEALSKIVSDCECFQTASAALLERAYGKQGKGEKTPYDAKRAGNDYWYTRNGHGTGFWDRGLGDVGEKLKEVTGYHEVSLYRGDDGKIYI